jgi:hypothetical protein
MAGDEATGARIAGRYSVLAAAVSGIIALGGGYVLGRSQDDAATELPKSPTVKLTQPEGPKIRFRNRLEGTVSKLKAGESVWTFTAQAESPEAIFPFPGPCTVDNGRWTCQDAYVGTQQSKGRNFIIWAAVVTDAQAARAVRVFLKGKGKPYIEESVSKEPPHVGDALDSKTFVRR